MATNDGAGASRWQKVADVLSGPAQDYPWEAVIVDGSTFSELGDVGALVASVALYPDSTLNIVRFSGPPGTPLEFMTRIGQCTPSVETLYRMERQGGELIVAGKSVYASADQRTRNEAILATAAELLADRHLPMAFANHYLAEDGTERIIFYGLDQVPLADLWIMYKIAVDTAVLQ